MVCKGDRLDSEVVRMGRSRAKTGAALAVLSPASSPERLHEVAELRDLYAELLPPRQREVLGFKIDEDLSLAEMAERLGVSRQACEDALKRAEKTLGSLEAALGLRSSCAKRARLLDEALSALSGMDGTNWRQARDSVMKRLLTIRNGGES